MIIHESIFLPKHLSLSLPEYLLYLYVKRIKRWFLHQCSASIQCVNVSDPAKLSCILPKSTTTTTIGGWWLKNKTKNWEHLKWQLTATPPLHTHRYMSKTFLGFPLKICQSAVKVSRHLHIHGTKMARPCNIAWYTQLQIQNPELTVSRPCFRIERSHGK